MTNFTRNVFYTGVTNNIEARTWEHKKELSSFTTRYRCKYLMYYEEYEYILDAIAREKQLKRWKWEWKRTLILKSNPSMKDLAAGWFQGLDY